MVVMKFSSTITPLRSSYSMPALAKSACTRGFLPVAIRTTSASISAISSTAVFILKVIPCFSRYLRRRLAISLSSAGRHSLRYSMTVISEPNRLNTEANSIPITPAPMIARRLGSVSSCSKPVESTTRESSTPLIGSHLVSEPVAMMMLSAV